MLNKKLLYCYIVILLAGFYFLFADNCQASLLDDIKCAGEGGETCDLNDFVKLMVNVAHFILSITGSLALLFFVYGGVMFLISAGSSERITKAKQILVGAVIGLAIVFTSYTIISFIMIKSGFDPEGTKWNTAAFEWWE